MNHRCLHSQHGFHVYGKSEYTEATCPKCLDDAYQKRGRTPRHTIRSQDKNSRENDGTAFIKSRCKTYTDTIR